MGPRRYALALAAAICASGHAAVEVEFVEPQSYRDAGLDGYGDSGRERTMTELRGHFDALGRRCLAADQTLRIRVLDIDLAGHLEWRRYRELRVMRDVTWPSMRLSWTLADAGGTASAPREERIRDMNYLMQRPFLSTSVTMPYDKAMVTAWFEDRFCAKLGASRN